MNSDDLLAELSSIALAPKVMKANPSWATVPYKSGNRLHLACPLWLDSGELPRGLRLEITCPESVPNKRPMIDMVATMFVSVGEGTGTSAALSSIRMAPDRIISIAIENRACLHRSLDHTFILSSKTPRWA